MGNDFTPEVKNAWKNGITAFTDYASTPKWFPQYTVLHNMLLWTATWDITNEQRIILVIFYFSHFLESFKRLSTGIIYCIIFWVKVRKKRLFGWNKGIVIFSKNVISFHHYGYLFLLVAIATYFSILVVQSLSSKKVHIDSVQLFILKKFEHLHFLWLFSDFTRSFSRRFLFIK